MGTNAKSFVPNGRPQNDFGRRDSDSFQAYFLAQYLENHDFLIQIYICLFKFWAQVNSSWEAEKLERLAADLQHLSKW